MSLQFQNQQQLPEICAAPQQFEKKLSYRQKEFLIQQNANKILRKVHHTHTKSIDLQFQCEKIQNNIKNIQQNIEETQFKCDRFIDYKYANLTNEQYIKMLQDKKEAIEIQKQKQKENLAAVCAGVSQAQRENMSKSQPEMKKNSGESSRIVRNMYFDYKTKRSQYRNSYQVCKTQENEGQSQIKQPNIVYCKPGPQGQIVKIDMDLVKKRQELYIKSRSNKRRASTNFFRF